MSNWFSMSVTEGAGNVIPMGAADGETAAAPKKVGNVSIHGPIADSDFWGEKVAKATDFIDALRGLGDVDEIEVSIHSPGGMVTEGWAIYNALKTHTARVTATVEGLAASMGSVIAMAADSLKMPRNAYLMIHEVSGGAHGNSKDLQKQADLLAQLNADIVNVYAERTGKTAEEIGGMMAEETWMNGERAHELGFADFVMDEVKAAAISRDELKNFSTVPVQVALNVVPEKAERAEGEGLKAENAENAEEEISETTEEGDQDPAAAVDPETDDQSDEEEKAEGGDAEDAETTEEGDLEPAAAVDPETDDQEEEEKAEGKGLKAEGDGEKPRRGLLATLKALVPAKGNAADAEPVVAMVPETALAVLEDEVTDLREQGRALDEAVAGAEATALEALETFAPEVLNELEAAETPLTTLVALMAGQMKEAHAVAAEIVATQIGLTHAEAEADLPAPLDAQTWDSAEEQIESLRAQIGESDDPKAKRQLALEIKALREGTGEDEAAA